eukprot:2264214-Prymnesium_polylepis.1
MKGNQDEKQSKAIKDIKTYQNLSKLTTAGAERLLAADEGRVDGRVGERLRARVHQVAEELPAGRHL